MIPVDFQIVLFCGMAQRRHKNLGHSAPRTALKTARTQPPTYRCHSSIKKNGCIPRAFSDIYIMSQSGLKGLKWCYFKNWLMFFWRSPGKYSGIGKRPMVPWKYEHPVTTLGSKSGCSPKAPTANRYTPGPDVFSTISMYPSQITHQLVWRHGFYCFIRTYSIQHILQHTTLTYINDVVGAIAHQFAAIGYPIPSLGFSHFYVPNIEITIWVVFSDTPYCTYPLDPVI